MQDQKTLEFLQKLKDSGHWNDDYDYSKVVYVSAKEKVIIIYKPLDTKHLISPTEILINNTKCTISNVIDKNDFFIKNLKSKGFYYSDCDYSKVNYIDAKTKIVIIDKKFDTEHSISPNIMLTYGIKCEIRNAIDKNLYIERVHKFFSKNLCDYSKVNYTGNRQEKIILIDKKFGTEHLISLSVVLRGGGCAIINAVNKQEYLIKQFLEIHGYKYDYSKVIYVDDKTKVVVECPIHGDFNVSPSKHKCGDGCPKCGGTGKLSQNEVIKQFLEIHGYKYDYSKVIYVDESTNIVIGCPIHGDFEQKPNSHKQGSGCIKCANIYQPTNLEFIEKLKEIYGDKYDYSLVKYENSKTKVIIICPEHGEFKKNPNDILKGQGCQTCNGYITKYYKLKLIKELLDLDLLSMDPVELQIIIQQGALPNDFRPLINTDAESDERIATLRELQERYESDDEPGELEDTVSAVATNGDSQEEEELVEVDDVDGDITETEQEEREPRLPSVNSIRDLHSLDNSIYASMDEEAFETLIQYKIRKYWNEILNEETDISKLRKEIGGKFFTSIKDEFLDEYDNVLNIVPAEGYAFKHQPNLMQKLTVYRLLKNKYYGNWSGTGAGKTLSFILASRNMDAKLTLVIALNSTIEQTCKSIKEVYPDSKCFIEYKQGHVFDRNEHNYLVLNYEKFQQENSERLFQSLTNNNQIDFIVIDEVHNAKQREEDNESKRREVMTRLLGRARENENLHVLAMSATPVINNLFEAKSLLSLMSGFEYNDLQTRQTIGNAIKIFQQLTLNGLRFIPKYKINISELTGRNMSNLNIDGSHLFEGLLNLPQNDYISVEKFILDDKLNAITSYIRKGVVIYSYFTTGIINRIEKHVKSLGFKVGTYTGEESTPLREQNLRDFISGKIDVLIGSRPIGTGVDGLQEVSNRMILLTLPWTDSEYTQLKGRIYRQPVNGEYKFDDVEIIIPQVKIQLEDGEIWSWDIQRLNRIKNKKTLADAAVDGVIPSHILPSKETMFRKSIESLKSWQDRIDLNNIVSSNRNPVQMNLYPEIDDETERQRRINSELSEFNRRGKTTRSETMHKEFTDNPDSWHRYHSLRKSRMESWEEIPYEYIATKIKDKRDVVADFGCGENLFKNCIPNNKVYSFDHIAIDETVIACDMKNTGLDNELIDVAIFSLALWGTNREEYIKEAYRVLKRKGMIYIAEPSKDYETSEQQQELVDMINKEGFQQVGGVENRGKFIYLTGIKI